MQAQAILLFFADEAGYMGEACWASTLSCAVLQADTKDVKTRLAGRVDMFNRAACLAQAKSAVNAALVEHCKVGMAVCKLQIALCVVIRFCGHSPMPVKNASLLPPPAVEAMYSK